MNQVNYLIECIPNISEGRDQSKIFDIVEHINSPKIQILNVDIGYDANRTVITLIGGVLDVFDAIKKLFYKTLEAIDMSTHSGEHPRLGAVDICPFVPFSLKDKEDLIKRVERLSNELSSTLSVPIFLYASSSIGENKTLPALRAGEYEGLIYNRSEMNYKADFGASHINKNWGGTVIGVRDFMVAYNININTKDLSIAKRIAKEMRTQRKELGLYNDKNIRPLQVIGWYMERYGCCQISTNIHNPRDLSIADVYFFASEVAEKYGVKAMSSELIGMIPDFAVSLAEKSLEEKKTTCSLIQTLGLDFNGAFSFLDRTIPITSLL